MNIQKTTIMTKSTNLTKPVAQTDTLAAAGTLKFEIKKVAGNYKLLIELPTSLLTELQKND